MSTSVCTGESASGDQCLVPYLLVWLWFAVTQSNTVHSFYDTYIMWLIPLSMQNNIHRNFMPDKEVSENIVMGSYVEEAAIYSAKNFSPCPSSREITAMSQPPSLVAVTLWWFSSAGSQWNDGQHGSQPQAHPLADGVGTITRTVLDDNVEQPRDCFTRIL